MKNNCIQWLCVLCLTISCGKDDSVTPLEMETTEDFISLSQNSEIEIFVFANDLNIPSKGQLSLTNPSKGTITLLDLNTPNNPSDDSVLYKTNPNEIGEDSFQYTICNISGYCKTETVNIQISNDNSLAFNLDNLPFETLSEYNFFKGELKNLEPNFGVIPYNLNSSLFSDYAKKKRFLWIPNNSKATYLSDDEPLNFPVGTILIKNFYYDNVLPSDATKIIETRLMIRKDEGWVFANYVWNELQDEAEFDLGGQFRDLQWLKDGDTHSVEYRIPSGAECHTCHKVMEIAQPIGPKPRNLNLIYTYTNGSENQLTRLIDIGYLENTLPSTLSFMPDYNDTSKSLNNRVRAYLDINCAHCHSDETHCDYRPLRLDYSLTEDLSQMGVCVDPDTDLGEGLGHIIEPNDARNSVLHFRLNSTEQSSRMPLLGRTKRHVEGVNLIETWINNLNIDCN